MLLPLLLSGRGGDSTISPPTSIATIQAIGVHRCVVPAEELTSQYLLATPANDADSSQAGIAIADEEGAAASPTYA